LLCIAAEWLDLGRLPCRGIGNTFPIAEQRKHRGRSVSAFFQELFRVGLYKRNQGRIARQATFAALATIFALGAWSLSEFYQDKGPVFHYAVPLVFLLAGLWASFRIVQMPSFADFLISVEGEMNKVSWPARGELFRASIVVMLVIFFLAGLLFFYDLGLEYLREALERLVTAIFG
jgi:preprotein translocase subunit SecE